MPDRRSWTEEFLLSKKQIFLRLKDTELEFIDNIEERHWLNDYLCTPRETWLHRGFVPLDSFFMIDYMVQRTNVFPIIDIGCGMNLFKHFFDIIGLDKFPTADIRGHFDEDFLKDNKNKYGGAIAINSLHFTPIQEMKNSIKWLANIIKPRGYGYITYNVSRLIEHTDQKFIQLHGLDQSAKLSNYLFSSISNIGSDIEIIYYLDKITETPDETIDGNLRILFRKCST
jgi:hypothetical protein